MLAKKLNRRQARWSLLLARFDFLLHHHPGKTMGKSDALSQRSDHGSRSDNNQNLTLLTPGLFAVRALEGLQVVGEVKDILKEIWCGMEAEDHKEVVVKAVKELKKSSTKSVKSSEWSTENGLLYYRGKIYVPGSELHRQIPTLFHGSKLAGHPRRWKTLELVSRNYWWPQMSRYIGKYVSTCNMCLQTKSTRQLPTGQLHPLPILDAPWDTISIDFIVELPESNRKDAIMIVVDSVTKWSHFVGTVTTSLATRTTQLYLQHIWKHHGLPKKVVSDRGPQFVAEFTLLDPRNKISSYYGVSPARRWTNRTGQPRAWAVSLPLHKSKAGWLGQPAPIHRIPVQQSCSYCNSDHPLPSRHRPDTLDGIQTGPMTIPHRIYKQIQGTDEGHLRWG